MTDLEQNLIDSKEENRVLYGALLGVIRMEIVIDYGFDSNSGSFRYWGFNCGTAVSGPCITSVEAAIEAFIFLEKE
jgi:hypothetical protein